MYRLYSILLALVLSVGCFAQLTDQQNHLFSLFFNEALKNRLKGDYQKSVEMYVNCFKLDEKSAAVPYEIARILHLSNDLENANKFIDYALANDDSNNQFYIQEAVNIKLALNKFSETLPLLDKLIAADKNNVDTYLLGSSVATQMQNYPKALAYVDAIPSDLQAEDYVLPTKYDILMKMGEKKKAYKLINSRFKKHPKVAKYNFFMADYHFRTNKNVEGLGYLKYATDCEDGDIYNFDMASLMLKMDKTDSFKHYSMRGFSSPNIQSNVKYNKLISSLSNQNMLPKTVDTQNFYYSVLDTLVSQYPDEEQFYAVYAEYCTNNNNAEKAISLYESLYQNVGSMSVESWRDFLLKLSSFSKYDDLHNYSDIALKTYPDDPLILLLNGGYYITIQDYAKALPPLRKSYSVLSSMDTNNRLQSMKVAVMSELATSYYFVDSAKIAFFYFDEVLKVDPYNATVLNNYSYYLSLEGIELDKAETMARKANEIDPGNSTFLDTYAWVLYRKNNFTEALFIIERAMDSLKSDHDNYEIYDHYGDILFMNNNLEKALVYWKKSYEEHPTDSVKKKIEISEK